MKVSPTDIPTDFWNSPVWNPLNLFISSTLAVVGIAVTYYIYKKTNKKKALGYRIITDLPLLNVDEQISGKIKISYKGKEVKGVRLVIAKIVNTGDLPINEDDYKKGQPFTFNFPPRKVIEASVTKTDPEDLIKFVKLHKPNQLNTDFIFNNGDSIYLKFLLIDFNDQIQVSGRLIGIKSIKELHVQSIKIRPILLFCSGLYIPYALGISPFIDYIMKTYGSDYIKNTSFLPIELSLIFSGIILLLLMLIYISLPGLILYQILKIMIRNRQQQLM